MKRKSFLQGMAGISLAALTPMNKAHANALFGVVAGHWLRVNMDTTKKSLGLLYGGGRINYRGIAYQFGFPNHKMALFYV